MECKNENFRHILLLYFRKGKNAAQAAKKLRDVYGEEAVKTDSVEIGLIQVNSVLGIFHSKMRNVQVGQMKLMMTKSKP